jgi:dTDP-4-dehydrorhamnose reductase
MALMYAYDTLQGNTLFPITLSHACQVEGIPWAHISSGCIYNGAKIHIAGETTVETDLTASHLRSLLDTRASAVQGFNEEDPPNFSFRHPPCSFYSGSKALAEESLVKDHSKYLWRLRIPFDEWDNSRNYLSKLQRYSKVYDNYNSLSHLRDFAKACLDLYECKVPYGTYNVTNPGYVSSRQVVEIIQRIIKPNRKFEYWAGDEEFYRAAVTTPRSNCILDVSKLLAAGIRIRSVEDALVDALEKWQPESNPARSPN